MLQGIHLVKDLRIAGEGSRCVKAPCAAAAGLFAVTGMRGRVGAEEDAIAAAGDQLTQRLLVDVALEDRQAVQVRAHAAHQHMVAVEHQVLRGDGGGQALIAVPYVVSRIFGGDVFKHHFQPRQTLAQWLHHAVDKTRFAVKNIDLRMGHFAMHQQRHSPFFHALQYRHNCIDTGHAVAGVGCCVGGIEFSGGEYAFVKAALNLIRIESVGQIAGHQWGKVVTGRHCIKNALAVGNRRLNRGDGRHQIWHHNRAAINFAGIRHNGIQHIAIAKMDMPVVWAADFQNLGWCSHG
ncbi:hypothetical protein D3C75_355290 [compost metagenome]